MQVSKHLEVIEFNEYALCFHSLLGNLNFLEPSYLSMLKKFDAKVKHQSNELIIVEELREAHYLEESEEDARTVIANRNKEWMKLIPGGGQLRLLNLVISEACNFGCKHCLHSCSVGNSETHGSKKNHGLGNGKISN